MNIRYLSGLALLMATVLLAGCPKGGQNYSAGEKAESLKDYDSALDFYNKALQTSPNNTEYKLKAARARFEAGQWHVDQGRRLREQSNLELALAEFRKAALIDPSSAVAAQESQATLELIIAKQGTTENAAPPASPADDVKLMAGPQRYFVAFRAEIGPIGRTTIGVFLVSDRGEPRRLESQRQTATARE